eukprot:4249553-Pleurochrysis_carterae.AAC.2
MSVGVLADAAAASARDSIAMNNQMLRPPQPVHGTLSWQGLQRNLLRKLRCINVWFTLPPALAVFACNSLAFVPPS